MEKSKELEELKSELEKENDELKRKVKILEGDLEHTEDNLDEIRQYD